MNKLQEYIKKCRKAGFTDEAIKSYLLSNNAPATAVDEAFSSLELKKKLTIGTFFVAFVLLLGIIAFNPSFIGFVTQEQDVLAFNDTVYIRAFSSGEIIWTPQNSGDVTSLLASGKIIGNGSVKAYITMNGSRYLLLDSSVIKRKTGTAMTGLVIDNTLNENESDAAEEDVAPAVDTGSNEEMISQTTEQVVAEEEQTPEPEISEANTTQEMENSDETIQSVEPVAEQNITSDPSINESQNMTQPNEEVLYETPGEENITVETNSTELDGEVNETNEINSTGTVEPQINSTDSEPIPDTGVENESETLELNETVEETFEVEEFNFNDSCVETCILPGIPIGEFRLEFEIESGTALLIERFDYTAKQVSTEDVVINETSNETVEIITINETIANLTTNVTANATINLTVNSTESANETAAELNATIIGTVEIEKPVLWKQVIDRKKTEQIVLPAETFNITALQGMTVNFNEMNFTPEEYNLEKQKDMLRKELEKLLQKQETEKIKKGKSKTNSTIENEIKSLNSTIKDVAARTRNVTIDREITVTLKANETPDANSSDLIELVYYTEGPAVREDISDNYNKKVTVGSNIHYTNIKAYTDIAEARKEMISLYWKTDSGDVKVRDINYVDTNNNGLFDRIEWTVPHLSNQTYEVNISVLNLHSYPMVGGTWTVEFVTTGTANLTIQALNGTVYNRDIAPGILRCGETTLDYDFDGTTISYQNFNCSETATFTATELRQGPHIQMFSFGDATAYAYNFAGNLVQTINLHGKLTNSTGGLVNESTNFTFSLYTAPTGGSAEWTETQNDVNVSEGIYSVIMGAVTPITVNFSQAYWLGIAVNDDPEMTPRINMTNTPNSYNSFYAQQALGLLCTDCVGNTEVNTTGTFNIDGNLNASNNITLGNSIVDTEQMPRIQVDTTTIIINLQD